MFSNFKFLLNFLIKKADKYLKYEKICKKQPKLFEKCLNEGVLNYESEFMTHQIASYVPLDGIV